jgi:carbon monoxide dehydrogenase subunit G
MKIEFGGDFVVPKKPDEVYNFLVDPERFCPLLPDYQSMSKQDDKNFSVNLRVGISHIRGTAVVKMSLAEENPNKHARYDGKGDVPGGTAQLSAGFDLEPNGTGTKVIWKGESQIAGRLPSLAGGLLEPLAKKNIQKLIDSLQKALS